MADQLTIIVSGVEKLQELAARYRLTSRQIQQIGTSAINRSLTSVQSHVVKRLAVEINMRQKDIRENVTTQKASYDKMEGRVDVNRSIIPIIDFIGTTWGGPSSPGVSVQVLRGGPRQTLVGAFIASVQTGHQGVDHFGVFERSTHLPTKGENVRTAKFVGGFPPGSSAKGFPYRTVRRFAIFERFGLTLTGYLTHAPSVEEEEQEAAGEILVKNLMQQINRRLQDGTISDSQVSP